MRNLILERDVYLLCFKCKESQIVKVLLIQVSFMLFF